MDFSGIDKLTIIDFPSKVACILFYKGCNFRCPYCHNSSLVDPLKKVDTIPFNERFKRKNYRNKKIRFFN